MLSIGEGAAHRQHAQPTLRHHPTSHLQVLQMASINFSLSGIKIGFEARKSRGLC